MSRSSTNAIITRHTSKAPVDLLAIANDIGIKIETDSLPLSISATLSRVTPDIADAKFAITINENLKPMAFRYALAKMIAHYVLHRDLIKDAIHNSTFSNQTELGASDMAAKQLAADIIMPCDLVAKLSRSEPDTEKLAQTLEVSHKAVLIRLAGLNSAGYSEAC